MHVREEKLKLYTQFCEGQTEKIGGIRLQLKEILFQGRFIFQVEYVFRKSSFEGKIKSGMQKIFSGFTNFLE